MESLELLKLPSAPPADILEHALREGSIDLHFNGRLVWGDIVKAIVAGRRHIAATRDIPEGSVEPWLLDIALYHPEEKALLVAVDYRLPGRDSQGNPITERVEWMITCGSEPRTVALSLVSPGHCARMLELMDVLDLTEVLWLPLRGLE